MLTAKDYRIEVEKNESKASYQVYEIDYKKIEELKEHNLGIVVNDSNININYRIVNLY